MKKKNGLKKAAVKLNLEKIEIDVLSNSMLNGIQGGYQTQPGLPTCPNGDCNPNTLRTQYPNVCPTTVSLVTCPGHCCTDPLLC
jgi:hypothetical protein